MSKINVDEYTDIEYLALLIKEYLLEWVNIFLTGKLSALHLIIFLLIDTKTMVSTITIILLASWMIYKIWKLDDSFFFYDPKEEEMKKYSKTD